MIAKGADIVNTGVGHLGQRIPLTPTTLKINYDPNHYHGAFVTMYDGGKMDGDDLNEPLCVRTCPPNPQFTSVEPSQVGPYFQMAEQYTFADRMFQTNQGSSYPAHQYILSGTSAPASSSLLFVSDNPYNIPKAGNDTGCTAPSQELVPLIDSITGNLTEMYPCFEHPTVTDLLDSNQISWRYYTPTAGLLWTAPNSIDHMCVPKNVNGQLVCTGAGWNNNVVLNYTQVLTDIGNGNLAGVTWVIPSGQVSDHATETDGTGPAWVASVVNAIGNSSLWSNTVIFITWDDWGGWYDHVAPFNIRNQYEYGFRVPMIVVSPYAKAGYISHVPHHFGSILKYIEGNFDMPSIGTHVGASYADAYPDTDDLSDCFDYSQPPIIFQTIQAPLGPKHFLKDKSPPLPPDTD